MAEEPDTKMFRPEALEHRARSQATGGVVRVGSRWADRAFWLLLALVAAALIAGALIRIDRFATGPTTVAGDGRVVILLPASVESLLEPGGIAQVGGLETEVTAISDRTIDPTETRERFGVDPNVPSVVVTTALEGASGLGTGKVLIGSQPVIVALVPGLDALLGGDDG